ncbi:hydroxyacid dehydrogenase [Streptomyces pluripotens]|uniref:Hydroxyacid dehydrogenase n=1 Tax=Streptomyces pluripotens TaxID=1355015 RepID=A0A221P6U8_9ACTN|nr:MULTISPECIES: 2-hydroxyacid dehydrogenase [Streptomyces]ARP73735.1 hydroxyacid dehydrogenase [Streptomyces pluripotens]ASN27981.1 hydroxyacid dehydrogenase [Streptomyces pluripotens]KIE27899.1 2-hydroxyacid dehydrogenase [Streptomyces sp. MUSC 125]
MTVTILAAGDHFVRASLLADALGAEHRGPRGELEIRELHLPWPVEPFGDVGEVHEASGTEEQLIEALRGARICVTQMAPLTRRVLQACPDLGLFAVGRGGPVNANLEAATEHGVAVTFAPGRNATATAEHTVAMLLAAVRRIPHTHHELVRGIWRGDYYQYDEVGLELAGTTVGLVGYGAIGHRVARILRGFGAHVLVHDPYLRPDTDDAPENVSLDELLARSRVLSLHARLTAENRGMIGAEQIAAMPTGSVIVNCARGGLLDYEAVCDALDRGHLFAAAFDVFPEEPVPAGSRLLHTPGVVMTPHLAGASKQTAHQAARICAAETLRYLRGEPLAHCANPEVLAGRTGTGGTP